MPKIAVLNQKGEQIKEIKVSPAIFNVKLNPKVLHQVVVAMAANQREILAHTKTKGEVAGGGKKPWRQKGTGRARHGSIRSPIWIGGGITFGPRNIRNFKQKINKKMRQKAMLMALSDRFRNKLVTVVESFEMKDAKTKIFKNILNNLKLKSSILVVFDKFNAAVVKSLNNLPKVEAIRADSLNAQVILKYKNLLITEPAVEVIGKIFKKLVSK
ncbi:50S ribosomal protein L4 [Candidatus Falkowbacteria bacterium]|nr:50S ribosomal protein L4 [Candidatus Falkowbacteria bacterium]